MTEDPRVRERLPAFLGQLSSSGRVLPTHDPMSQPRYPEIEALERVIDERGLELVALEGEARAGRCRISISATDHPPVTISVDDEYGDAARANPPLLLHLVLAECETWEEAPDFPSWVREAGLDPAASWVAALGEELDNITPVIRSMVGGGVKAISSWDVQMNSGAARALRERS